MSFIPKPDGDESRGPFCSSEEVCKETSTSVSNSKRHYCPNTWYIPLLHRIRCKEWLLADPLGPGLHTLDHIHNKVGMLQVPTDTHGSNVKWFCARTDKALSGIPGVFKLLDNILMVGDNVKQLLGWIKSLFKRCQDHGITLSNTKFQVGSKVKFAGYVVSDKGKELDPDKIAAIAQFQRPDSLTDLQLFMELANQFSDFSPDLRHAMEPMKGLLQKKQQPHKVHGYGQVHHHRSSMCCSF